jgi:hypothetical protein
VCNVGAFVDGESDAVVCFADADHVEQHIIHACLGDVCDSDSDSDSAPDALKITLRIIASDFGCVVSEVNGVTLRLMEYEGWFQAINANVLRQRSSHLLWPVMR